jgi:hypothetical protein
MHMFAVTYTDPSEPWGHAVEDGKLYRTPTALLDALNAHFDAWCVEEVGVWKAYKQGDDGQFGVYDYMSRTAAMERAMALYAGNYEGQTLLDALVDEYDREYGVARYQVAD